MGVGTILLIVFVVIPAVQWSVGGGKSRRGRARKWGGMDLGLDGGGRLDDEVAAMRNDLESRLGEIEHLHARVAELENRLDFTERLLAHREPETLAKPPGN